jgi:hypothetical protein
MGQLVPPTAWSFYRFTLGEDDYQVIVTLAKDAEKGGYGRVYLRHETLPDSQWRGCTAVESS